MSDKEIRANEAQIRANCSRDDAALAQGAACCSAGSPRPRRSKSARKTRTLEIEAIAARTDESVRRVRARIEKEGGPTI